MFKSDQNNNKDLAKEIEILVTAGNIEAALKLLDCAIERLPEANKYYIRGRLYWKLGRKSEAMSDYSKAVSLDPASPAAAALTMAREVMDFYNHDLYNP